MDLFDAVVLSQLLASAAARAVLFEEPDASSGDQRRLVPPDELFVRARERADRLCGPLDGSRREAERLLSAAETAHMGATAFGAPGYPRRLLDLADPPPVLWSIGAIESLRATAVAVVGSRAGSAYAHDVAERLGARLASRGICVVSGLARGVDGAAHRGALRSGGTTAGVLGSGLDVVYPAEHGDLARQVAAAGVLVSEYGPGTPPRAFHFPRRNRIISGLATAVVVVEAGERSGSLITARCAAEQGRDVFVVPGNALTGRNRGGHALVNDGAKVVETADDILEEIGEAPGGRDVGARHGREVDPILRGMDPGASYDVDQLAASSGLDSQALIVRLTELEVAGRIRRDPGGRFSRLWR